MTTGVYLYCISGTNKNENLGNIGLYEKSAYSIGFKDIGAIVSDAPFKEIQPNVNEINWHQQVVEASREKWTTLPVRFGTMFKSDEGVKKYLEKSYKDLRTKITKFENKDEYGIKVVFDKDDLTKIDIKINDNTEIKKIREKMAASGQGASYFLKLRMDEAVRNEVLKKVDEIGTNIHKQLSSCVFDNCVLKADIAQIILSAAYLVDRNKKEEFDSQIHKIKERYESSGIMIHISGPWAPYSFC
ncbi:MAG: GvpL/GvpF family gas vesicle protein [Thaumarchaeota archaeon]|nr:GvpL/GvpF family gas vesicle protein [Nitrososphaerota archaeon]